MGFIINLINHVYYFILELIKLENIHLTDEEAHQLIKILKLFLKKYNVNLKPGNKETLKLYADDYTYDFLLDYYTPKHRNDKISIHLREKDSNINLVRVNIDSKSFHLNSNGERLIGNRILIFSSEEFKAKKDGYTHTKAFSLPEEFSDTENLEQVFLDFLVYINVKQEGKVSFPSLF